MEDPRDKYIRRVVAGKTFIDIGGLSNVINERVSTASAAGATSVTMMDVEGPQCPWWNELRQRLKERGVTECDTERVDRFGGWKNLTNYYPNWFIPTVSAFEQMARCGGFDVVEGSAVEPNEYSYCLLLRPN